MRGLLQKSDPRPEVKTGCGNYPKAISAACFPNEIEKMDISLTVFGQNRNSRSGKTEWADHSGAHQSCKVSIYGHRLEQAKFSDKIRDRRNLSVVTDKIADESSDICLDFCSVCIHKYNLSFSFIHRQDVVFCTPELPVGSIMRGIECLIP